MENARQTISGTKPVTKTKLFHLTHNAELRGGHKRRVKCEACAGWGRPASNASEPWVTCYVTNAVSFSFQKHEPRNAVFVLWFLPTATFFWLSNSTMPCVDWRRMVVAKRSWLNCNTKFTFWNCKICWSHWHTEQKHWYKTRGNCLLHAE